MAWRVKESIFENKGESNHGLREDSEDKDVGQDRDSDIRAPERPDLLILDITPLTWCIFATNSFLDVSMICNVVLFLIDEVPREV